jgi:hypothetical protein
MAYAELSINGEAMPGPGDSAPHGTWEWGATWEQRIDGVGQASVVVQDRDTSSSVEYAKGIKSTLDDVGTSGFRGVTDGWRDVLKLTDGAGANLFWGEVTNADLLLPTGHPYRRWNLSASDFNTLFDQRLVGVPDGYTWISIDGGQTHIAVDPNAKGLSRDGDTLKALLDTYVRLPLLEPAPSHTGSTWTFDELGSTTYVRNWIPRRIMLDPATGESRLQWRQTTLRAAIDEMRGLAGFPIYCWIDPDLEVHWESLPGPDISDTSGALPLLLPRHPINRPAPATLVHEDVANHSTSIGFRDLKITYDATYMPQQAYVNGTTDFVYAGATRWQGTGFAPHLIERDQKPYWRQISVDAEAVTDREKIAVAKAYQSFNNRSRIRGTVTVGSDKDVIDTWRVGQQIKIFDARLPPSLYGKAMPIQAVRGSLKAGQPFRVYTLEFGDFPIARFSQKYRSQPQKIHPTRLPARKHKIYMPTTHLRPSTAYTIYSQMVDASDKPVRRGGIPVDWSLVTKDRAGVAVSAGTLVAITSETDEHGRTAATLTTGATTDLHYHVTARTAPQT